MADEKEAGRKAEPRKAESRQSDDAHVEDNKRQVQQAVDRETEQGYRGVVVDQTPNENYTFQHADEGNVPEAQEDPAAARREATKRS